MTSLDELDLFSKPSDFDDDWPPTSVVYKEPRRCKRHQWVTHVTPVIGPMASRCERVEGFTERHVECARCPAVRDEVRAKRGKSSRRLGHDGERRSEKRYGWSKVGEFGGITDLQGTLAIVQQKTSRRAPPPAWQSIFRALETRAGGRVPLILLSYVRHGVDTEDFIVIRGRDWLQLHGRDEEHIERGGV